MGAVQTQRPSLLEKRLRQFRGEVPVSAGFPRVLVLIEWILDVTIFLGST